MFIYSDIIPSVCKHPCMRSSARECIRIVGYVKGDWTQRSYVLVDTSLIFFETTNSMDNFFSSLISFPFSRLQITDQRRTNEYKK